MNCNTIYIQSKTNDGDSMGLCIQVQENHISVIRKWIEILEANKGDWDFTERAVREKKCPLDKYSELLSDLDFEIISNYFPGGHTVTEIAIVSKSEILYKK